MFPKIVIQVPWWVWAILIVCVVGFIGWAVTTEPDPHPSLKNIIQHIVTLWARDVQTPRIPTPRRTHSHSPPPNAPAAPPPPTRGPGFESKGEQVCRAHMESRFGVPFQKARPAFLKNPVTGENLEIDVFNEDLGIGVEYNGKQHYQFNSHFHRSSNDRFQNQQYRDLIKKQLCDQNGITLIIVPYWVSESDIPSYIDEQLDLMGDPTTASLQR